MAEDESIEHQASLLIAAVDNNALMQDAMENVIDYAVPLSIRESVIARAYFTPTEISRAAQEPEELETNSTVQKIGEIVKPNGELANMYVAAVATEVKVDQGFTNNHGIKAWAYVYWIDNPGADNELHAAGASWETSNIEVSNRKVSYGVSDLLNFLWYDGPTAKYPTSNSAYYEDPGSYIGNVLRCETRINVVGKGYVTCNVTNNLLT